MTCPRTRATPLDIAAIEDWTARNKAARDAYLKRVGECGKPTKRLTAAEQAELDATRDHVLARLADRDRN